MKTEVIKSAMKVVLEFELPEDNYQFRHAIEGARIKMVISDYIERMRQRHKYHDLTEEQEEELHNCRTMLGELLEQNGLWHLFDME